MRNKIVIIFGLIIILFIFGAIFYIKGYKTKEQNHMEEKITRLPAVSGTFYPDTKERLLWMLSDFFGASKNKDIKNIKAIIAPHAGIIYSGQIAASAYKQIEDYSNIKHIIIIGPSHNEYLTGFGLSRADKWQNPLGNVEIDKEISDKLSSYDEFSFNDNALQEEHSIEVQIPFLQNILKTPWKLTPIIAGSVSDENIKIAASHLAEIIDDKTLLVISTDLSHYNDKDTAKKLDQKCINSINNLEFDSECEACGEIGIKLLLEIAKQKNWKSEIIRYGDSGDITHDNSSVVGYVSAIFMKNSSAEVLTKADRSFLLSLARNTIDYAFKNSGKLMPIEESEIPENLKEKRGVFVTLNENNKLRGCIGYIEPIEKLYKAVQLNALSASFEDTRFNPLSQDELKDVTIEISILTIPKETGFKDIRKNIDGVVLRQGNRGATYLPQVWENIEDEEEFFGSLCQKAGLDWDCYKEKETQFFTYEAEVFSE